MAKLIVSLSPHIHAADSIERNMYGVLMALLPALAVSLFYFGLGSAIVCLTSVLSCIFFEWTINKYLLKNQRLTITDGSAALTGILLGLNMPSNLPVWIVIIGSLIAIGIGKMTFGGLGRNPFNPALVGRCFLLVSFPAQMTTWPIAGQLSKYTDAETAATPLNVIKYAIQNGNEKLLDNLPDSFQLLLGYSGADSGAGSMGEVCALAILIGFVFLLWKRIITWHIPVSIVVTAFVFAAIMHLSDPAYASPLTTILSGGMLFGAVFMATDYVTSPMTHKGQVVYGVCIGLLTMVIRNWGSYPEGMSFAILIMNAFTPLINIYMKPKRFATSFQRQNKRK